MKILYISCHAVLEYDEVLLFTQMGHEVLSFGAYRDPRGAYTLPRPGIPGMAINEDFIQMTANTPKTDIPQKYIDWADVIIFMSGEREYSLLSNWEKIKKKRVIWRSIGQSTGAIEKSIKPLKDNGLIVVRYSPREAGIPNYAGSSAIIRFYKDQDELCYWSGDDVRPVNFTQSLRGRGSMVFADEILFSLVGFQGAKIYGSGNTDLGDLNGGDVSYDYLKKVLKSARVFVYGGTIPASYTLSFIEAYMMGVPIVALQGFEKNRAEYDYYEIPDLIIDGVTGYLCTNLSEVRRRIDDLLNDSILANRISLSAREKAIDLFGKEKIRNQWQKVLEG